MLRWLFYKYSFWKVIFPFDVFSIMESVRCLDEFWDKGQINASLLHAFKRRFKLTCENVLYTILASEFEDFFFIGEANVVDMIWPLVINFSFSHVWSELWIEIDNEPYKIPCSVLMHSFMRLSIHLQWKNNSVMK